MITNGAWQIGLGPEKGKGSEQDGNGSYLVKKIVNILVPIIQKGLRPNLEFSERNGTSTDGYSTEVGRCVDV